jgi:hypothetical protein
LKQRFARGLVMQMFFIEIAPDLLQPSLIYYKPSLIYYNPLACGLSLSPMASLY